MSCLTISNYVCAFNVVTVTFDPVKRLVTLQERGLDFATDAEKVFAGDAATFVDDRFDYGEVRRLTVGWMNGRMVVMVWPTVPRIATSFR